MSASAEFADMSDDSLSDSDSIDRHADVCHCEEVKGNLLLEILKADSSLKSKAKRNEWTWKAQTDVVKWQATPLRAPLLRLPAALAPPALECFTCIRAYCGDLQPPERAMHQDLTEVKCVYTVLMHCHSVAELRDEVYCQLMKQTTSNRSHAPDSCQRAWRLMSILSSYFTCSETLRPFLVEYLSAAAADRRRPCQGTAAVCLANFRKTMRCGGRKNVPSVEEVTAVSAGRSARRQLYRLPGGAERVVNTRCATVVQDIVDDLCELIGVCNPAERAEFSLYCIVAGDSLTMPLAGDEYVLDVTTELQRAQHPFYLIFCRSVWHHPLRTDAPPLYTEVLFNQVAPDYLEGLLLVLPGGGAPAAGVLRDAAVVAALLHRAAGLPDAPHPRDLKFLLPKPLLALKEPRPNKWASWVGNEWPTVRTLSPAAAKSKVLQVLSRWSLFGSSFFAVRRVQGGEWREHVLALNRRGLHLLHPATHDTDAHWPYADLISTRKVRSEDGTLFLDVKCGSLLQQRVTRLQAEQAHEIARLIRQYIALQRDNREGDSRHSPGKVAGNVTPSAAAWNHICKSQSHIGVCNPAERAEFSLYCIVAGDSLTMPLAGDEYVLDVTTELQRAQHPFYLIFCRSVWHHPLRTDAPPLYTEVLFNQ
ncbi:hypothetical protein KGM_210814A, partial [Danaus plexippus plexippus]